MRRFAVPLSLASSIAFFACGGGAPKPASSASEPASTPASSSASASSASIAGLGLGDHPNDSFGQGGLGMSGVGEGSGGPGDGIGLGSVGGLGQPSASSSPRPVQPGPKLKDAGTAVDGRLPPEVIKRIVRANFPRLRACYESALKKKPDLAGSIKVEFVIDEKGVATGTKRAGGTLKDDDVAACVVKVFASLSFPEPEGGKVKVGYPIDFQPE